MGCALFILDTDYTDFTVVMYNSLEQEVRVSPPVPCRPRIYEKYF